VNFADKPDEDRDRYEGGKIALLHHGGKVNWRITVYVGDSREELDRAADEAWRLHERFVARVKGDGDG
jgi:hypothetical protein